MKFPRKLGVVKAKIHHDLVGKLRTVTIYQMSGGRYYASFLIDDEAEKVPSSNALLLTETLLRSGDALYETLPRTRTRYRYANTSRIQKATNLGALVHQLLQGRENTQRTGSRREGDWH